MKPQNSRVIFWVVLQTKLTFLLPEGLPSKFGVCSGKRFLIWEKRRIDNFGPRKPPVHSSLQILKEAHGNCRVMLCSLFLAPNLSSAQAFLVSVVLGDLSELFVWCTFSPRMVSKTKSAGGWLLEGWHVAWLGQNSRVFKTRSPQRVLNLFPSKLGTCALLPPWWLVVCLCAF